MTGRSVWIGPADRPLAARLWAPAGTACETGVLLVPAAGYEYWTSHQTLRAVAEDLAARGHMALRVDHDGTGDSSGEQTDPDRWSRWCDSVGHGVGALRGLGARRIVLVGLRLGATIALLTAAEHDVDAVAAVAPITSGRRYAKELTLLSGEHTPPADLDPGAVYQAGSVFTGELMAALGSVDLTHLERRPAPRVLIVPGSQASAGRLAEHLRALGTEVAQEQADDLEQAFGRPAEEATVADSLVAAIGKWAGLGATTGATLPQLPARATLKWRGGSVTEEFVRVGRLALAGVLTHACGEARATVVLLNSGSEVHVGPGRAWVEYARELAHAGYETLRVDFRGWGDSPDGGHAPGRPYDLHTWEDTETIVADLRARGRTAIVLGGLCAGAWVALKSATLIDVDGVIAINPQMYWQPGDPVEALMSTTRARRASEIAYFKAHGAQLERTTEHPASTWLAQLRDAGAPVLTLFASRDDGIQFLEDRLPQAWRAALESGVVRAAEVDIDHPMHRHWQRHEVVREMLAFLETSFVRDLATAQA